MAPDALIPAGGETPRAPGRDPAARCVTLGTACLVLSILEFVSCLNRLAAPLVGRAVGHARQAFLAARLHRALSDPAFDAAHAFARKLAGWEALRTVPFVAATAVLFWIGLRLHRGETGALPAARRWTWGAFSVIGVSLLIQVLVTVPMTLAFQRHQIEGMMAGQSGSPPPFDLQGLMSSFSLAATVFGVVISTLAVSAWPVVLLVWTRRIERMRCLPPSTPPA